MTRPGYVLRQLKAKPLRTLLTAGAFALSVGLLGFLIVLNEGLQQDWSPYVGQRLIVMAKTSMWDRLPIAYLPKIEATPGVKRVAAFDFVMAFHRENRPENQVPLQAAPPEALLDIYLEADVPKDQAEAWRADPTGALIGPILAKKLGLAVGDRLVLKAPVAGGVVETTVRAVMGYRLDNGVYLHRRYLEALTGDTGQVGMFWVLAKTREDVERITAALEKEFENAPVPARAMTEKQWQLLFLQMLGNVKLLIGSIGLATAFALLLITSNSLAMSARERRGETALLRVLGFGKGDVARLLLGEAAVYGVLGALLGTGLIKVFCRLVKLAVDQTAWAGLGDILVVTPGVVAVSVFVSAALSLTAGVLPAIGVARTPLAQVLHGR